MPHLDHHALDGVGVFALCVLLVSEVKGSNNACSYQQSLHEKFSKESMRFAEPAQLSLLPQLSKQVLNFLLVKCLCVFQYGQDLSGFHGIVAVPFHTHYQRLLNSDGASAFGCCRPYMSIPKSAKRSEVAILTMAKSAMIASHGTGREAVRSVAGLEIAVIKILQAQCNGATLDSDCCRRISRIVSSLFLGNRLHWEPEPGVGA
ncbi:hypothetical protein [Bradyrhizobium genosp. P]|uniref:hypothetical protein n=1 Tax=Bradyrhizobium genosp. P TaxID=83641 RepID=UPI003CF357C0